MVSASLEPPSVIPAEWLAEPTAGASSERQDKELEAEQRRGREMLERYAKRNEVAAAARERMKAEEKAEEIPGFKISPEA